jgi:hypothetical protein
MNPFRVDAPDRSSKPEVLSKLRANLADALLVAKNEATNRVSMAGNTAILAPDNAFLKKSLPM